MDFNLSPKPENLFIYYLPRATSKTGIFVPCSVEFKKYWET